MCASCCAAVGLISVRVPSAVMTPASTGVPCEITAPTVRAACPGALRKAGPGPRSSRMIMRLRKSSRPREIRRRRAELEQTRRTASPFPPAGRRADSSKSVAAQTRCPRRSRHTPTRAERSARQAAASAATTSAATGSASTAGCQRAGLRTYPAPRRVWIIGSRPLSIFLRRYETYSSTMLDRPPKS